MRSAVGTSGIVRLLLERAFGQRYLYSILELVNRRRCILVLRQDSMELMNKPLGELAVPCGTVHHKFDRSFLVSQQTD